MWDMDALLPHMDSSIVFARWRHCAPHPVHACLGPPQSTSQTASWSVQPFLHSSRQRVFTLYNGPPFSPQNCPLAQGSGTHLIHASFGLPKSTIQTASWSVQPFLHSSRLWQCVEIYQQVQQNGVRPMKNRGRGRSAFRRPQVSFAFTFIF